MDCKGAFSVDARKPAGKKYDHDMADIIPDY
jgi:hypothetical protein